MGKTMLPLSLVTRILLTSFSYWCLQAIGILRLKIHHFISVAVVSWLSSFLSLSFSYKNTSHSWVSVAQACNPSYSGGTDQKDYSSKTAQTNSSWDPISKKTLPRRADRVAQGVHPEFKPQYCKKKKEPQLYCIKGSPQFHYDFILTKNYICNHPISKWGHILK
jgi:hypothetical protein